MSFTVRSLSVERKRPAPWKKFAVLFLTVFSPILRVYRSVKKEKKAEEKRTNTLKRVVIILLTVLCALLLIAGTVKAMVSLQMISLSSIVGLAGSDLPVDANGHTNILLLGQGDAAHDGADLTDTIMVASVDPKDTESVILLSIPRDLYIADTQKMSAGRINGLYSGYKYALEEDGMSDGEASQIAMKELAKEIGSLVGVDIHHVVKIDFIGFVQAVDAVGGIDIVVPETLVDAQYPGPNYTYQTFIIRAGPQHLDGETALKYARSRHSTSDFDRARRQQQLIQSLGEKFRSEGILTKPSKITSLIRIIRDHFETTMEGRELITLAKIGADVEKDHIGNYQLSTGGPGGFIYTPPREQFAGASVLLPYSWEQVRGWVDLLFEVRTPFLEKPSILILNAGAPSGSSRLLGTELETYGFNVERMENSEDGEISTSVVEGMEEDEEFVTFLANMLGMKIALTPSQDSPESSEEPQSSPSIITIYLGEDYAHTPLHSLLHNDPTGDNR